MPSIPDALGFRKEVGAEASVNPEMRPIIKDLEMVGFMVEKSVRAMSSELKAKKIPEVDASKLKPFVGENSGFRIISGDEEALSTLFYNIDTLTKRIKDYQGYQKERVSQIFSETQSIIMSSSFSELPKILNELEQKISIL